MSNGNSPFERFSKLFFQVGKLVMDGNRDAEKVADILHVILIKKDYYTILMSPHPSAEPVLAESSASDSAPRQATVIPPIADWRAEMTTFYHEVFGRTVDFTNVEISFERLGFAWAMIIAQGLTLNQTLSKCGERFKTHSYLGDDLDTAVPTNDRTSATAYVKMFRDRMEADEENQNLSADALTERKMASITLLERLVLELWYHWRTGQHLDISKNVTLCAGSRHSDGRVPCVRWLAGKLEVSYSHPGYSAGNLRSRSAV